MDKTMAGYKLEIVIPVYNEREIIAEFHQRVWQACTHTDLDFCVTYVDDGSSDGTAQWIAEEAFKCCQLPENGQRHIWEVRPVPVGSVKLIQLSRNFGQPAAILAGLKSCTADAVILMDGDGQDPPELIPSLVERWRSGDEIVIAQRTAREETYFRGLAFKLFHGLFRYLSDSKITANTGTFCLMSRVAVTAVCSMPESHRFFPGLRAWVGFQQSLVTYRRPPRVGGEPKQTFLRLLRYAKDAVFGYSLKPLRLLTGSGMLICAVAFSLACWFIFKRLIGWESATIGFTMLTCAVFCLGGFQLIGMGVLGEYVGRIYDEAKGRPPYFVSREVRTDANGVATTPIVTQPSGHLLQRRAG
jgi:dolichol-phosphate mannosyltransferase